MILPLAVVPEFVDAFRYVFVGGESVTGGLQVGGPALIPYLVNHLVLSFVSVAVAVLIAVPLGLYLGHTRRAEFLAVNITNAGRAIPPLALIGFFIAYIGVGFDAFGLVLVLLAIPPILTSTYVATTQIEPDTVDAARGMGLTEGQILRRVEFPLGLPTTFSGIRIATVAVVATATIAPFASVDTLGVPILSPNVHGPAGQLGAAVLVAILTLVISAGLGAVQQAITPRGLKTVAPERRRGLFATLRRRTQTT
ncbi:MAG: ABC transporter permease [Thermoleophilaceae bacterium]|nr:ABC transporter permease [Thermoleophilaceae bacterium]